MKRTLILAGLVALLAAGSGLGFLFGLGRGENTTVTRLSPDETIRARLVEGPTRALDRTVSIRLEYLVDGRRATIYRSPDEGRPEGTERLIWSKDGSKLLVVGRHFFVKGDLFLDNGDQLYFLHDLPSGRSWSNAAGATIPPLPPLRAEQVRGVEFTEPVVLKGG